LRYGRNNFGPGQPDDIYERVELGCRGIYALSCTKRPVIDIRGIEMDGFGRPVRDVEYLLRASGNHRFSAFLRRFLFREVYYLFHGPARCNLSTISEKNNFKEITHDHGAKFAFLCSKLQILAALHGSDVARALACSIGFSRCPENKTPAEADAAD
jgi:hypothetical protein